MNLVIREFDRVNDEILYVPGNFYKSISSKYVTKCSPQFHHKEKATVSHSTGFRMTTAGHGKRYSEGEGGGHSCYTSGRGLEGFYKCYVDEETGWGFDICSVGTLRPYVKKGGIPVIATIFSLSLPGSSATLLPIRMKPYPKKNAAMHDSKSAIPCQNSISVSWTAIS